MPVVTLTIWISCKSDLAVWGYVDSTLAAAVMCTPGCCLQNMDCKQLTSQTTIIGYLGTLISLAYYFKSNLTMQLLSTYDWPHWCFLELRCTNVYNYIWDLGALWSHSFSFCNVRVWGEKCDMLFLLQKDKCEFA